MKHEHNDRLSYQARLEGSVGGLGVRGAGLGCVGIETGEERLGDGGAGLRSPREAQGKPVVGSCLDWDCAHIGGNYELASDLNNDADFSNLFSQKQKKYTTSLLNRVFFVFLASILFDQPPIS